MRSVPAGAIPYVAVKDFLAGEECSSLAKTRRNDGRSRARVQVRKDGGAVRWINVPEVRSATITTRPRSRHIALIRRRVLEALEEINGRCFAFVVSRRLELSIIRYQPGDRHTWHSDALWYGAEDRKLSFVIQLSRPCEYVGGSLEMFADRKYRPPRCRAALVVFPSFMSHRVTPVRRGVRVVLAGSLWGPRFR